MFYTGSTTHNRDLDYFQMVELPEITRAYYTFEGWYLDSKFTTKYTKEDIYGNPHSMFDNYEGYPDGETFTFYAKWKENVAIFKFNANGGSTVSDMTLSYTGSITLPSTTRSSDSSYNYTFAGWQYGSKTYAANEKFTGKDWVLKDGYKAQYELTAKWNQTAKPSSGGGGTGTCLSGETLILMADGSQKAIREIEIGDYVLTWDLFTGQNVVAQVFYISDHGFVDTIKNTLVFSDGTIAETATSHGFFDVTLGQFVYFKDDIGSEYIGHEFMKLVQDENGIMTYETVTLTDYIQERTYEDFYEIVTAYHLTHYANNLLSITGGIDGLFNIFEVSEDMKYDEEKMNADIEKYGLFTYEDFADVATIEEFEAVNAKYFKVAIGKGILTMEQIHEYIQEFLRKE